MLKQSFAFFTALSFVAAFAAVDVNQASEAELDGIKGVGPATSRLIVAERSQSRFKNWADFIGRVKGLGDKSAARFSAQNMTVNGEAYETTKVDAKTTKK